MTLLGRLKVAVKGLIFCSARRDRKQRPDEIIDALAIKPGDTVVDLGAGTGYYTFRLSRAVGPDGRVYAVDTDADLLESLDRGAAKERVANLRTTHPRPDDAGLPEPADLVFLSHVYHHLPDRVAYFDHLARSLNPGGRVAIIEGRIQGLARIFGHASDPAAIRGEMEAAGYHLASSHDIVSNESFQVFTPAEDGPARDRPADGEPSGLGPADGEATRPPSGSTDG